MFLIQVWYVRCEAFGFETFLMTLCPLSSIVIHLLHFVYLFVSLYPLPFLSYSFRLNIRNLHIIFFNFAKYFLPVHILFCYNVALFTKICNCNFIMRPCLWWTTLLFGYSCNIRWKLKIQLVVTYPVYNRMLLFIDLRKFNYKIKL